MSYSLILHEKRSIRREDEMRKPRKSSPLEREGKQERRELEAESDFFSKKQLESQG